MLFYDFEVFKYDWLVVIMDMDEDKTHVIINSKEELEEFYQAHKFDIWCGFNSRHYDQYILKAILCGFSAKRINDYIIVQGNPGWKFNSLLNQYPLNNYDVMNSLDPGLKALEGFMGNNIRESGVPFDIDRKLTEEELAETVEYCKHDVEQTIEVFIQRKEDFEGHIGLVKLACEGGNLDLSLISKTKPQLSAIILGAVQRSFDDEFDIDFPSTMRIHKYRNVVDWYKDTENRCYVNAEGKKNQLNAEIAGVPHQFGYGGVHGAIPKYHGKGYFINMDVASLYPSLMIRYNLHSRAIRDPRKFENLYKQRLIYKAEKNPLHAVLKLVLNSTYGVMKDKNNALYDPRQANRVCVYGQLLLLDLIEKLEPYAQIIQSNTDGVLIKMPPGKDEQRWYDQIDDIGYEWEKRTGLKLEFDEYSEIYQKDVNNYIILDRWGNYKSKGGYVKKLSNLDYDLPIVNKALVAYMTKGVPIHRTISECNDLKEFQFVTKISSKYTHILHGGRPLKEKCVRAFASKSEADGGLQKIHAVTNRPAKIANSPEHCFIWNDEVNGVSVPSKLDRSWYIDFAKKRLTDFGVIDYD